MKTVGGNKSRWAQMHHSHRLAAYTNLQILVQGKSANVVIKWSDKAALSYGNGLKGIKASGFYGYIYSVEDCFGWKFCLLCSHHNQVFNIVQLKGRWACSGSVLCHRRAGSRLTPLCVLGASWSLLSSQKTKKQRLWAESASHIL